MLTEESKECLLNFGDGDVPVAITYKSERVIINVSSHALCHASPVWKKFLFPPFAKIPDEIEAENDTRIDFTEDAGDALLILLRITHLQFHKVESTLPIAELVKVAVLCDQYDCVQLVRPWLHQWIPPLAIDDASIDAYSTYGWRSTTFLAWVFGMEKAFKSLTTSLVRAIAVDENGEDIASSRFPVPPGLMENIYRIREDITKKLLNIPKPHLARLDQRNPTGNFGGCSKNDSQSGSCNAITYGSIVLGLIRNDLWPLDSPKVMRQSISTIKFGLSEIEIHYPERGRHSDCSVRNFKAAVDRVLDSVPSPVLDSHLRHMAAARGEKIT